MDIDRMETPASRYIDSREKRLLMNLLSPSPGERILNIIKARDDLHLYLKGQGCQVTIFDLNQGIKSESSLSARAEDLPFSDNEFDIVTLIASLEFTRNPQRALTEAVRVSRGRVFLGVQNRYSLIGAQRRMGHLLNSQGKGGHLFSIGELKSMIRNALGSMNTHIKWGSVIFLPYGWYSFAAPIEENIPVFNNPFGAFLGISFSVAYRYRTIQERLSPFKLGIKRPEVSGTIRGALQNYRFQKMDSLSHF